MLSSSSFAGVRRNLSMRANSRPFFLQPELARLSVVPTNSCHGTMRLQRMRHLTVVDLSRIACNTGLKKGLQKTDLPRACAGEAVCMKWGASLTTVRKDGAFSSQAEQRSRPRSIV